MGFLSKKLNNILTVIFMTFHSDILETCKYYGSEQTRHLLAEVINNASKKSALLIHNESNDDWINSYDTFR